MASAKKRAKRLARDGWYVVPARSEPEDGKPRKSPRGGPYAATRDESQIARWFDERPDDLVAVAPFKSGVSVVDLDVRGGVSGLATLEDAGRYDEPSTVRPSLSGNGRHWFYQGVSASTAGFMEGVDLRGRGAIVVVAGDLPPVSAVTTPLPVWVPTDAGTADSGPLSAAEVAEWIEACPAGDMTDETRFVAEAVGVNDMSRTALYGILKHLAGLATEGARGIPEAIEIARERYLRKWPDPKYAAEFDSALAKAMAKKGAPGSRVLDEFAVESDDDFDEFEEGGSREERAFEAEVGRQVDSMRARREAQRRIDAEERGDAPTFEGSLLTIEDVLSLPAPEPLIEGVLDRGTTTMLYGAPATGKSFVALHWAWAIATAQPWLGREVRAGRALYVAAEGASGLGERVRALGIAWPGDAEDRLLFRTTAVDLSSAAEVADIAGTVAAREVDFVVLDTLARVAGDAEENSSTAMSGIVRAVDAIRAARPGCTVVLVHHEGKSGDLRGSSAILGALDVALRLHGDVAKTLEFVKRKEGPVERVTDLVFHAIDGTSSGVMNGTRAHMHRSEELLPSQDDKVLAIFADGFSESSATKPQFRNVVMSELGISYGGAYNAINRLQRRGLLESRGKSDLFLSPSGRSHLAQSTDPLDPPSRKDTP